MSESRRGWSLRVLHREALIGALMLLMEMLVGGIVGSGGRGAGKERKTYESDRGANLSYNQTYAMKEVQCIPGGVRSSSNKIHSR
jgi:hypothetical protein